MYKKTGKKSWIVFFILRSLVVICAIVQLVLGNFQNVLLCILTLILFLVPAIIQKKFRFYMPSGLEITVYVFIFCAEILGEISNFYGTVPLWDTILHTVNGFVCAGFGFSLVELLNRNSKKFNLSPLFMAITAFCFSMTIGVLWEFFEFGADWLILKDMQKDRIVTTVSSVLINGTGENVPLIIRDITETTIKAADGSVTVINGYLDIGLIDTMKDLIVNFIGAVIFSVAGFFYFKTQSKKYRFVKTFISTADQDTAEEAEEAADDSKGDET